MNTIKAFLIVMVIFCFALPIGLFSLEPSDSSTQSSRWHKAAIITVLNESKKNIQISYGSVRESACCGKTLLKQRFVVPFVSIKLYMPEILNGNAYVPHEALCITTSAGRFGLWEDERGIQVCKYERDFFSEETVESLLSKDHLNLVRMLSLKVNESGSLGLISD